MANTRIPHVYIESIMISKEMPPQMRVLHWYYRMMFGWNKHYKAGFFKVKSFNKVADEIGIDTSRLHRVLKVLSSYGFFSIDFKKKEFYLNHQKIVKFDKKSEGKKIVKNDKLSCQKEQKEIAKFDNTNCQKEQKDGSQPIENKEQTMPLKHSLKQVLKTSTKAAVPAATKKSFLKLSEMIKGTPFDNIPKSLFQVWCEDYKLEFVMDSIELIILKWSKKLINGNPEAPWQYVEKGLREGWINEELNKNILQTFKRSFREANKTAQVDDTIDRYKDDPEFKKYVKKALKDDPFANIIGLRRDYLKIHNEGVKND